MVENNDYGALELAEGASKEIVSLLDFFHYVALAGGEEKVRLDAVLARVEAVVTPAERVERLVIAALDNEPAFDHQNLVGAADGGEARTSSRPDSIRRPRVGWAPGLP